MSTDAHSNFKSNKAHIFDTDSKSGQQSLLSDLQASVTPSKSDLNETDEGLPKTRMHPLSKHLTDMQAKDQKYLKSNLSQRHLPSSVLQTAQPLPMSV